MLESVDQRTQLVGENRLADIVPYETDVPDEVRDREIAEEARRRGLTIAGWPRAF